VQDVVNKIAFVMELHQQVGLQAQRFQLFIQDRLDEAMKHNKFRIPNLDMHTVHLPWQKHSNVTESGLYWANTRSMPDPNLASLTLAGVSTPMQMVDLSGTWVRDRKRSDSLEAAVRLIKGLEIAMDQKELTMKVFSYVGPWFKVTERYPLNGDRVKVQRRDMRRGQHVGYMTPEKNGKVLVLRNEWPAPMGGTGVDVFTLLNPDELHIHCSITVGDETAAYLNIYTRKKKSGKKEEI
jgi:hypothetical protein